MKKRILLTILLVILSAYSLAAKEKLHLKIGTYENSPKIFTKENGEISGFWADITKYIAEQEDWKIKWIHGTWDQCLQRLENNEIDIMIDVGVTPSRKERFAFSNETVLLSWTRIYKKKGSDIQTILDLEGKQIAGLKGSFDLEGPEGLRSVTNRFHIDCEIIEMEDYVEIFHALEDNEIDAGITDKDFGNIHDIDFNIEKTPIILQPARMQFAFSKNSELTSYLIERTDFHIKELKKDNNSIFYSSVDKYLGGQDKITIFPLWLKITIAIILTFAIIFSIFILILKSQVKQRTKELRRDITERRRAEERIEHLNLVLYSIRKVNQLITKEKDRDKLIKETCNNLIETRGYHNAWIVLLDESGKFITSAEAGLGKDFLSLIELIKKGKIPATAKSVLKQNDLVVTGTPINSCKDYPLAGKYEGRGGMTIRLEYKGKIYGLLSVSVSKVLIKDEEEQDLFKEIASDIAFALYNLEIEEERKRIVDELRESEERFSKLSNLTLEGILIHDKGVAIDVNESLAGLSGYSKEEMIGKDVIELFIPQEYHAIIKENINKSRAKPYEVVIRKKDNTLLPIEIEARDVKYKEQEFRVAAIRDITERKRAEDKIKESEHNYRILFNNLSDGIFVLDAETQKVVLTNKAIAKFYGFDSEADAINVNPIDFILPEDKETVYKIIAEDMFKNDLRQINEFRSITKDGREIWISAVGVRTEYKGRLSGLISIRDITKRKHTEDKLKESEEFNKKIIASSYDCVKLLDLKGNLVFISEGGQKLMEIDDIEPMLNKSWIDCWKGEDYKYASKAVSQAKQGLMGHFHGYRPTQKGTPKYWDVIISPICDSNGKVIQLLTISRDITEKRKIEEDMKKKMNELQIFNDITVGRELKMLELKKEINELLKKMGKEPKYEIVA